LGQGLPGKEGVEVFLVGEADELGAGGLIADVAFVSWVLVASRRREVTELQARWGKRAGDGGGRVCRDAEKGRSKTRLIFFCDGRYYIRNHNLSMVLELKLRKVGNSVGVVFPKEALSYLKVGEGDVLCVTEGPEGCLRISPAKADFSRQMQAAQDVVARYRNTLRELAK
jgi:putative addiction module antidote